MKVRCVDNWMYEHLLKRNEIYDVIKETSDDYIIMIDRVGYVAVSKYKFIVEEDKMETPILKKPLKKPETFTIVFKKPNSNKTDLKINDRVTIKNGIIDVPNSYKDKIFTIKNIFNNHGIISNRDIEVSIPLELLIKIDEEKEIKKEEVRVVRKLEDLDGLKNNKGWELHFESTDNFKDKGYYREWVRLEDKSDKGWYTAFYEINKKTLDLLIGNGFKFEYKPLRTEEEVLEDVKRLACDRSQDCRVLIIQNVNTGIYTYTDDYKVLGNGKYYFQEETAYDLINELNSALEREK